MISKVLIANRGVAAVRIAATLKRMGVHSVALRCGIEAHAAYFSQFDEVIQLDGDSIAATYLNQEQILACARQCGAQAIHPGYGFLSESAEFAHAVAAAGLTFIGPQPDTIRTFGLKHLAREHAAEVGVSLLPGSDLLADETEALAAAEGIGYPVILKSTAGGGGIGMQRCNSPEALSQAFVSVSQLAAANFDSASVYIEKFLQQPRHVEVQIFGDGQGGVVVLGDRDCSLQRRNQKLIEECPAPNLPAHIRAEMHRQASELASSAHYASAGTVEFLYDPAAGSFYFLEVNTRLQVEHGVTEMVFGIDLVDWMVQLAAGNCPPIAVLQQDLQPTGHAIQARLYAEDPYADFRPSPGHLDIRFADVGRVDTWCDGSTEVAHLFDPLLANLICHGPDREQAIQALDHALDETQAYGSTTNRNYLRCALAIEEFRAASMSTHTLQGLLYQPAEFEVLDGGLQTTVQSCPGRQGYWEVGVPPSGPMDDFSFQVGNTLLQNDPQAAGLEMTFSGATLLFRGPAQCVVTGADTSISLDGEPLSKDQVFTVLAGQKLELRACSEGMRTYLLIRGGLNIKAVLDSTATFTLGAMGGHDGRQLRSGDVIGWSTSPQLAQPDPVSSITTPALQERHQIRVLVGPHAAPDFLTTEDIDQVFTSTWKVHHNSSRTGVRLIGPKPAWARADGGEAGLHPSNIHDNAYAFGALDFTGDMPVILGPDGPSLGGFVCPAVVINADRWKLGQLVPGDEIALKPISTAAALKASTERQQYLGSPAPTPLPTRSQSQYSERLLDPVLLRLSDPVEVTVRRSGEEWLLVEMGSPVLDIKSRIAVHELTTSLKTEVSRGLVELTPGVRSLQIRYQPSTLREADLVSLLRDIIEQAIRPEAFQCSSRIVHMPLSWEDPVCQLAVDRYQSSVRSDAPWCPDNVEFIRRINGLPSKAAVRATVYDASYMVLGLGDVYLGAPVATPLDPRHRLVTTKYNPARTWTAENSVGIGGAYLCVYGMEGPGGYQFVGRTTPVWRTSGFAVSADRPWLLNHFDQLQFYPVDAQELLELREAAKHGAYTPAIENTRFDAQEYSAFLNAHQLDIAAFDRQRSAAFEEELNRWQAAGAHSFTSEEHELTIDTPATANGQTVLSPMSASVWRVEQTRNAMVDAETVLLVLEAMKSEVIVRAPIQGRVNYLVREGQTVTAGQTLAVIE